MFSKFLTRSSDTRTPKEVPVRPQGDSNVALDMPGDNDIIDKITTNLSGLFESIRNSNKNSKKHIESIKGNLQGIQEALQNPKLQEKVSELEGDIIKINEQKEELNKKITELQAAQKKLQGELKIKEQINSEAITNKKRVDDLNKELSQQNEKLNTEIKALQNQLRKKDTDINGKLTQINELVTSNMELKKDSEGVAKQLEELQGLYGELLSSNPPPVEESEEDTYNPPVEYQPGDGVDSSSVTKPGPKLGPVPGDDSSSVTKPELQTREAWGPNKLNDPNNPQQTGGRKTRHRGKSRKNKKTRKNKKQKKTTKK